MCDSPLYYKGFYIWKGYDDPMYTPHYCYYVCKYPKTNSSINYLETPLIDGYNFPEGNKYEDAIIDLIKTYIDKYIIDNPNFDFNIKNPILIEDFLPAIELLKDK